MTIFTFANNVNTTLAGAVSSSATSLTLSSTKGLPTSIPAGTVLAITLNDVATRQNFEVIYATAISGATLSGLLRGQEGTAALSWLTNDFAYSGPTAGQQASFGQVAAANTWTGQNTFSDPVIVGAGVTSGEAVNLGQFPSSLTTNGYKKHPDPSSPSGYFIEQWGVASCTANAGTVVTLPIAFPTNNLHTDSSYGSTITGGGGFFYSVGSSVLSNSTILITVVTNFSSPTEGINWRAIGY